MKSTLHPQPSLDPSFREYTPIGPGERLSLALLTTAQPIDFVGHRWLDQSTSSKMSQSILFPEKLEIELRYSSHLESKGPHAYVDLKAEMRSVLE